MEQKPKQELNKNKELKTPPLKDNRKLYVRELTRDERAVYPLRDYDFSIEEEAEYNKAYEETDGLVEFANIIRHLLIPSGNKADYEELNVLDEVSINDVRRHQYSDQSGREFEILPQEQFSCSQKWLPIATDAPHIMIRKWTPNEESWARLIKAFGPDMVWWQVNRIRLRIENGIINGYADNETEEQNLQSLPQSIDSKQIEKVQGSPVCDGFTFKPMSEEEIAEFRRLQKENEANKQ